MKTMYFIFLLLILPEFLAAQSVEGIDSTFYWRNIGPSNQGGRIVDIEALDDQFNKVFMATGSGGVWKSVNAGTTWTPIFDNYSTASIGDIAIYQQDPSIIGLEQEKPTTATVFHGEMVYSFQKMEGILFKM